MKYFTPYISKIRTCLFSLAALVAVAGCRAQNQESHPNRAYFEIHPITNVMVLPITINDTVAARLVFDTGSDFGRLQMDSTFCAAHPLHLWQPESASAVSQGGGSAWIYQSPQGNTFAFNKDYTVTLGPTDVAYDRLSMWDQKGYFGHAYSDGLFNMPVDTAHVWELNFEHNYIELHPASTFKAPEGCLNVPIQLGFRGKRMFAKIPMKITTSDGDTITINRYFLIDTGMRWDAVIVAPAEELAFFEGKAATPFHFGAGGYISRHIVDATVFDGFPVDSLRIYTLKDSVRLPVSYHIGLNFLKRFNVFIDFKNSRMYLQPLKEFHRVASPGQKVYCIETSKTAKGSYIITASANHEFNPYQKAGVRVGDEIVGINGVRLTSDTPKEKPGQLLNTPRVIFDIIRDGKPIQLVMERDPRDVQGD